MTQGSHLEIWEAEKTSESQILEYLSRGTGPLLMAHLEVTLAAGRPPASLNPGATSFSKDDQAATLCSTAFRPISRHNLLDQTTSVQSWSAYVRNLIWENQFLRRCVAFPPFHVQSKLCKMNLAGREGNSPEGN